MSFNGSGTFVRLENWTADAAAGVLIRSDRMDTDSNDFASGLTNCICKDGQSTTSAIIPFSQGVKLNDGVVGTPSLAFTAETSTGLYRIGSGSVGITAAGTLSTTFTASALATTTGTINILNTAQGTNLASASTVNIGAATGNYVNITGTTTITAFDTIAAGATRTVTFSGILTLTYNATSLILPGAGNITTAAGDSAIFTSLGSGNWKCTQYQTQGNTPGGGFTASSTATLTNKTYDTAGTGNVFKVNGTGISAVSGTGAVVLASGATLASATLTSPTITTGALGSSTATTQTTSDNSTKVATTAFVKANVTALTVTALAVGAYAWMANISGSDQVAGTAYAAAGLQIQYFAGGGSFSPSGDSITGTWQAMMSVPNGKLGLYQRAT